MRKLKKKGAWLNFKFQNKNVNKFMLIKYNIMFQLYIFAKIDFRLL